MTIPPLLLATTVIRAAPALPCQPWPRHLLDGDAWRAMVDAMPAEPSLALIGLWADAAHIHALFLDDRTLQPLAASVAVEAGRYLALSPVRPGAILFERVITDLWGHEGVHAADLRPWLDHGYWPAHQPMAPCPVPAGGGPPPPPEMLPAADPALLQVPVGPVHGVITAPAHWRVTADRETITRLETRLGYTHRGLPLLVRGLTPRAAAPLAARLHGGATVAHATAFARSVEAALDVGIPPRAQTLRAIMAELERMAGHLLTLAATCAAAGDPLAPPRFHWQRHAVLEACDRAFGHRLMMDWIVPGGLAANPSATGLAALETLTDRLAAILPDLARLLDRPGLTARLRGVGVTPPGLIQALGAGGPAGRAAGRPTDARHIPGASPPVSAPIPVRSEGDADARLRQMLFEIEGSVALVRSWLQTLPVTDVLAPVPGLSGEGFGTAESAQGDVWHWVRLAAGEIVEWFPRDPAWLRWPLLEAAAHGATLDDLPVIAASLDPVCAGIDL